jgi:hypothetical protein
MALKTDEEMNTFVELVSSEGSFYHHQLSGSLLVLPADNFYVIFDVQGKGANGIRWSWADPSDKQCASTARDNLHMLRETWPTLKTDPQYCGMLEFVTQKL